MPKRKMVRITEPALTSVTVKMPIAMQKALERLADLEFTSVSGLLKKGAEKLLLEHGINWRKNEAAE